jgi:hypothetical protein
MPASRSCWLGWIAYGRVEPQPRAVAASIGHPTRDVAKADGTLWPEMPGQQSTWPVVASAGDDPKQNMLRATGGRNVAHTRHPIAQTRHTHGLRRLIKDTEQNVGGTTNSPKTGRQRGHGVLRDLTRRRMGDLLETFPMTF